MSGALPLSDRISQTSSGETEFRILETRYGNGYSQRARDGINNVIAKWNVSWEGLTYADMSTITTAIDTSAGVDYFTWQPPGDTVTRKWIVRSRSYRMLSGDIYSVSCTLEQCFDL
jgi:phage-related protein